MESRAGVGEQSLEEETAQAERQHQGEDSEAEDMRFKLKVAAVVRVAARAKRFAMAPYQRFRPAVGRGGAAAELDPQVHWNVCEMAKGVEFTLTTLSERNGKGRWFVAAQNYDAVTRMHDVLPLGKDAAREPRALVPSSKGGWCLVDKLPDTDELSGNPMDDFTCDSRWQQDLASLVAQQSIQECKCASRHAYWTRRAGKVRESGYAKYRGP